MKTKIGIIFLMIIFYLTPLYAEGDYTSSIKDQIKQVIKELKEKEEKPIAQCPITKLTEESRCLTCHIAPSWKVKEADPLDLLNIPSDLKIINAKWGEDGRPDLSESYGYYQLKDVNTNLAKTMENILQFLEKYKVQKLIIEVDSWGGGLFSAWRIVGLLNKYKNKGNIIETYTYGKAVSAGFILFISGNIGHRYVSPNAELMWHEVRGGSWFKITTPSSAKDEAAFYKHLQDNLNKYIASRSKLTVEEIHKEIEFDREMWMTGQEAFNYGVADELIQE